MGAVVSLQVETDGTNGGIIQLWDINGLDIGANVSFLDVITNAQLVGLTRRYPFKFYDRMPDTGLLIYLYGESAGEVLPPDPYKTQP